MKKNKIIVAVIFVLSLYVTLSAMSDDGGQQLVKPEKKTEVTQEITHDAQQSATVAGQERLADQKNALKRATIAQLEGYALKNVWIDQEKEVDIVEYEKMKEDYKKKLLELGRKDSDYFWQNRVNLDIYEQLKKDKEVSEKWEGEFRTTEDKILLSQVIVIGEVISREYDNRDRAHFKTSCNVKVDEVLFNRYFKESFPSELIVKIEADLRIGNYDHEPNLVVGKKYVLFLTKYALSKRAKFNKGFEGLPQKMIDAQIEHLTEDVDNVNVFSNIFNSSSEYDPYTKDSIIENLKAKIYKIEKLENNSSFFQNIYK